MDEGIKAPTRSKLALKGSSKLVSDFFEYSIHSILYQRGIYPAADFKMVRKYGLNMLVSMDDEVVEYVAKIMKQVRRWTYSGIITRLVLAIVSKDSGEVVERWRFDLDTDREGTNKGRGEERSDEAVKKEIQSIIRQITASVTFLPELDGDHTFNVLVYADPHCKAPEDWKDSQDAKEVEGVGVESVKFRSFSTDNHSVATYVTYRVND